MTLAGELIEGTLGECGSIVVYFGFATSLLEMRRTIQNLPVKILTNVEAVVE